MELKEPEARLKEKINRRKARLTETTTGRKIIMNSNHTPKFERVCRNETCHLRKRHERRQTVSKMYKNTMFVSCPFCSKGVDDIVNGKVPYNGGIKEGPLIIYCSDVCR